MTFLEGEMASSVLYRFGGLNHPKVRISRDWFIG